MVLVVVVVVVKVVGYCEFIFLEVLFYFRHKCTFGPYILHFFYFGP